MFTRLYDYDTSGQNPVLAYSYRRESRKETPRGSVRSLPAENWRKQPPINAEITDCITIFQNGQGNSSFELCVEGLDAEGHTGYYHKQIYDRTWDFCRTDAPLSGKAITAAAKDDLYTAAKTRNYQGTAWRGNHKITARIEDFWPHSPPGTIIILIEGKRITGKLHTRKFRHESDGRIVCAATIELPEELHNSAAKATKDLFRNRNLIDMTLVCGKTEVIAAEDLHIAGLAETADTIISLVNKNGLAGELKAEFGRRLKFKMTVTKQ
jgi:hypothetical protein